MKPRIKIYDSQFGHAPSFGTGNSGTAPTYFDWYRGLEQIGDWAVVTESWFHRLGEIHEENKIAMLLEPPEISGPSYLRLIRLLELRRKFVFILTHDQTLVDQFGFKWYPQGGCWLKPEDQKIYPKTKHLSLIYSGKDRTYGHKLRHLAVDRYGHEMDHSNRVDYKLTHLKDYRYHLVIENSRCPGYFTEKIIDAFRAGCIPIYWGDPEIVKHFDMSGIIVLPTHDGLDAHVTKHSLEALDYLLLGATPAYYEYQREAVRINFERAGQFCVPEDWLWNQLFRYMTQAFEK